MSGDATSRAFQIQTLAPDFLMSLFSMVISLVNGTLDITGLVGNLKPAIAATRKIHIKISAPLA